ncbi:phosphatidylinositol-specific phospholipase C/glycerophosphodiester phosphodiesterase family protein [Planctomycetes bacterium K23_9]
MKQANTLATMIFVVASFTFVNQVDAQEDRRLPVVHPHAHAHNDYLHARPLLDALDQGFCSVEADIYLVDGELLVAHDRDQLKIERSLKQLYLEPLRKRIKTNAGKVHPDGPGFTLLIDIKSDAESTFLALNELLGQYDEVFTRIDGDKVTDKAVTAIVSGNRANETILAQSPRFVGIDGRLSDLNSDLLAHQMPLISDHWGRNFRWRGDGAISDDDAAKLKNIIQQVHARNRRVRFWSIPDKPIAWKTLHEAGVDLINTDKLKELSVFLQ